jgi:NACHT domain
MTSRSGPPAGQTTAAFVTWLATGAVGPALVGLPVNWAASKLADAALRWFKRLRKTDDLSRLVKAAVGPSIDLSKDEFGALREFLEKEETWALLATGILKERLDELTTQVAGCLLPRPGRTAADSREAAEAIARGLVEFAVFELEPEIFQKVVLARLGQMINQASALDQALFRMHKDLYHTVDEVRDLFIQVSDRLPPGPADIGEVKIYLKTLVGWLNADPWAQDPRLGGWVLIPAAIERTLRISARQGYADADKLARRCSRLVILGGPGSGKTWLAMRAARTSAEQALNRLDGDASLDEVELPLYITCSRLISTPGDIREAVASSALNWIGDLGGSRIAGALRLRFTERAAPTLLVIDSLDEASDPGIARDRLRQVSSLTTQWRVVLTSRPSSWSGQLTIDDLDQAHQVGELQPLRYPDDVEPVVRQWFADDQARGQALIAQFADRPSLQEAATVPLILAFYCIVGGQQPLPEFRHKLHEQVINRLLRGPWRSAIGPLPDVGACRAALRAWAWHGAANCPVSGVGQWQDDIFAPDVPLSPAGQIAVGHIASPMAGQDFDTDQTPRRFVHRSIREHLVAEYVAGLPSSEAVDALLPHLWYDPDWEYTAPAAIAMHPEHDAVLRALLLRAGRTDELPIDLSAIDGGEIRGLLARVAAESKEPDWSTELARIIGQARIELARLGALRDLEAAYWPTSTGPIREVLPELLARADYWEKLRLAPIMARLDPARRDEYLAEAPLARAAIGRLVEAITRNHLEFGQIAIDPDHLGLLYSLNAPTLEDSATTEPERAVPDAERVRKTLRNLRDPKLDGLMIWYMTRSLPPVDPMDEDGHQARQVLLSRLRDDDGPDFSMLVAALTKLSPTEQDKLRARQLICERLANRAESLALTVSGSTLIALDPTISDLSAWRSWAHAPTASLLVAVRRNSVLEEWLDLLPALAGLVT